MALTAADMMTAPDPLLAARAPERVNYATGVLLQAEDFRDEQTYHRSRLATMLAHLLGHGTLAGLAVRAPDAGDGDLHLRIEAGVAVDRHGRLIEVTEDWCTRLALWFAGQETADLRAALHLSPRVPVPAAVVADVFLTLADCGRGKTPSFAHGPFDALDALVPARLGEAPRFTLVLRTEDPPDPIPTPQNFWPHTGTAEERLAAVLGSYRPRAGEGVNGGLAGFQEHVEGEDAGAVLLARIAIPVSAPTGPITAPDGPRPVLEFSQRVHVDNSIRPFIVLPGKWLGTAPRPVNLREP